MKRLMTLLALGCLATGCDHGQDWLTRESWLACPQAWDYHQSATFFKDGSGELVQGDSQAIRHEEDFRYQIRPRESDLLAAEALVRGELDRVAVPPPRTFDLQFTTSEGRAWSGQVELQEGRFEMEKEGRDGKLCFELRLRFSSCPFDFGAPTDYFARACPP